MAMTVTRNPAPQRAVAARQVEANGTPVKVRAKLEFRPTNECDSQPILQTTVSLPNGRVVNVELRNPAWTSWQQHASLAGKTYAIEGQVILNRDLQDLNKLEQGTRAQQKEAEQIWNDLYMDSTHYVDAHGTDGVLIVDNLAQVGWTP